MQHKKRPPGPIEGLLHALRVDIRPMWGALPDRPHEPERAANLAETMQAVRWRPRISLSEGLHRTAEAARREAGRGSTLGVV